MPFGYVCKSCDRRITWAGTSRPGDNFTGICRPCYGRGKGAVSVAKHREEITSDTSDWTMVRYFVGRDAHARRVDAFLEMEAEGLLDFEWRPKLVRGKRSLHEADRWVRLRLL